MESELQNEAGSSTDFKEGVSAFLQKRDAQFKGGALANDGRVVFAPAADHSFVGVFDPETDTFTKFIAEGPGGLIEFGATHPFKGAARLGDGRVAFAPAQATFVGVFDPATGLFAKHDLPASLGGVTIEKFGGAAATPDGCAVFSPSSADAAGKTLLLRQGLPALVQSTDVVTRNKAERVKALLL